MAEIQKTNFKQLVQKVKIGDYNTIEHLYTKENKALGPLTNDLFLALCGSFSNSGNFDQCFYYMIMYI